MKLIIDIPKKAYELFKEWHKNNVASVEQSIIANGIPYEERLQGDWITDYEHLKCPFCGMSINDEVHWLYSKEYNFNFCPNCGAKLEGGAEE